MSIGQLRGMFPQNIGAGVNAASDPTYTSGANYAQSIAGGQNVPNMIAPGVSYSAAQPQGYTQADLNRPVKPPKDKTLRPFVPITGSDLGLPMNPGGIPTPPGVIMDEPFVLDGPGYAGGGGGGIKSPIYSPFDFTNIQDIIDGLNIQEVQQLPSPVVSPFDSLDLPVPGQYSVDPKDGATNFDPVAANGVSLPSELPTLTDLIPASISDQMPPSIYRGPLYGTPIIPTDFEPQATPIIPPELLVGTGIPEDALGSGPGVGGQTGAGDGLEVTVPLPFDTFNYQEAIDAFDNQLAVPGFPQVPVQTTAPLIPIEEAVAQQFVDPNIKVSYKNLDEATAPAISAPVATPPSDFSQFGPIDRFGGQMPPSIVRPAPTLTAGNPQLDFPVATPVAPQLNSPEEIQERIAALFPSLIPEAVAVPEVPPILNARGEPLSAQQTEEYIRASKQMADATGTRNPFALPQVSITPVRNTPSFRRGPNLVTR